MRECSPLLHPAPPHPAPRRAACAAGTGLDAGFVARVAGAVQQGWRQEGQAPLSGIMRLVQWGIAGRIGEDGRAQDSLETEACCCA